MGIQHRVLFFVLIRVVRRKLGRAEMKKFGGIFGRKESVRESVVETPPLYETCYKCDVTDKTVVYCCDVSSDLCDSCKYMSRMYNFMDRENDDILTYVLNSGRSERGLVWYKKARDLIIKKEKLRIKREKVLLRKKVDRYFKFKKKKVLE